MNNLTQNVIQKSTYFLEQDPKNRLAILREIGLGRYGDFLTKMPLTTNNINCVQQFFDNSHQVKFPKLRNADLSALILDGVNFIRADLTDAKLNGSRLLNADLILANLTNADLRNADLQGSTLNATIWKGTLVDGCNLGKGIGLTQKQRQDLEVRGAVFEEIKT